MSFLLNPFRALTGLLGAPARLVGKVLAYSDGVAQIEEPGGGVSTAIGSADVAVVGQWVYFSGGVIEGPAGTFDTVDIIDI